jgi:Glycosyl transferase family 2
MGSESPTVCFVSASGQNVFFDELLDAMRDALEACGVPTRAAVDHFPELEPGLVYVVVPHEYFALTFERAHPREPQLARTIAIETEQPGTHWFEHAASIAARCAVTIDINRLGVSALRRKGIDARYMRFGYVPGWDVWGGDPHAERPIDVCFMGGGTPRRTVALGRCAGFLSERRTALHLFETFQPHTQASAHFLAGERKWRELARSKVIVNVHRDELGYFEWQRVLGAIANGCVVLTEHSLGHQPLIPGRHYVSTSYDSLPYVLESLLDDEERLHRIRTDAYALLRDELTLARSIGVLRDAAHHVLAKAGDQPPLRRSAAPRPAPKPPQLPTIEYARLVEQRDEGSLTRMALKHLLLGQRRLRRELDALRSGEAATKVTEQCFGPYERVTPRVSVLITVFNYERAVREAIESVAASTYGDFELVIVDDASHDGSVAAVREALAELPWLPAKHLVRTHNAGLPAARNLAAGHARGEYLLILDADNSIYPNALERLAGALDADPGAAFAYGILEQVSGDHEVVGLMSWLGWDPLRLRYGNYIDAMAMIRRGALRAAGGYTTDVRLYGWEDFALWCAFANAGWRGVRIPEIVGRYVAAAHSMIAITNIDATEAYAVLGRDYPFMTGRDLSPAAGS